MQLLLCDNVEDVDVSSPDKTSRTPSIDSQVPVFNIHIRIVNPLGESKRGGEWAKGSTKCIDMLRSINRHVVLADGI